jgi:hypothetical protein
MTLSPDNGMEITKLPCDPEGPINPVYVPEGVASTIPNMISGTPEKGWYEPLDSSEYTLIWTHRASLIT